MSSISNFGNSDPLQGSFEHGAMKPVAQDWTTPETDQAHLQSLSPFKVCVAHLKLCFITLKTTLISNFCNPLLVEILRSLFTGFEATNFNK